MLKPFMCETTNSRINRDFVVVVVFKPNNNAGFIGGQFRCDIAREFCGTTLNSFNRIR